MYLDMYANVLTIGAETCTHLDGVMFHSICVCLSVCERERMSPVSTSSNLIFSRAVNAEQANLAIVTSLPLLSGITIIYFIYQTACHACSLPPPVSDALSMPLNANETLALHVIEQRDSSSKYAQQMSLIS